MDWGNGITYLATAKVKGQSVTFGIHDADRLLHMSIVGKSGSGKPGFLVNMALQDIARGVGVLVLDSVGNVTQTLLERIPANDRERLIVLDPSDGEHPYSWDVLDDFRALPQEDAFARLSEMLASMYQCENGALVGLATSYMLSRADATLLSLYDLVTDEKMRDRVLPPKSAERQEFEKILAESPEAVSHIAEHGKYLAKDVLMRNILGQRESKFTLDVLQKGGIVVVDLSRIRMFPTRMTPLVRLFAGGARARALADAPVAVYLHDCLRYFSVPDFERMLLDRSVVLTFSDTSHGEEESTLREKALQRSGSVVAFSPHEMDAQLVGHILYPYVPVEEFEKLQEGECAVMLAIDAVRSKPFFAKALPLSDRSGISPRDLELESRSRYTTSRLKAEELFNPKHDEKEEKPGDTGSFSDAFRSIFTKRAGTDTPVTTPPAPASTPKAPSQEKSTPLVEKKKPPEEKGATVKKPAELSEEELKKILHVGRTPS